MIPVKKEIIAAWIDRSWKNRPRARACHAHQRPEGACTYISADAREPEAILADPRLRATLDLSEPVALMLFGIMPFLPDEARPREIVATLLGAPPADTHGGLAPRDPSRTSTGRPLRRLAAR